MSSHWFSPFLLDNTWSPDLPSVSLPKKCLWFRWWMGWLFQELEMVLTASPYGEASGEAKVRILETDPLHKLLILIIPISYYSHHLMMVVIRFFAMLMIIIWIHVTSVIVNAFSMLRTEAAYALSGGGQILKSIPWHFRLSKVRQQGASKIDFNDDIWCVFWRSGPSEFLHHIQRK